LTFYLYLYFAYVGLI